MIITCCYRPLSGAIRGLENVFKKANTENKLCFVAGDFNLNCLDYNNNLEIRTFYNRIFVHSCIPMIRKPTRIRSKTVSLIGSIFTNFIFDTSLKLEKVMCLTIFLYLFPYVLHQKFTKNIQRLLFIKE